MRLRAAHILLKRLTNLKTQEEKLFKIKHNMKKEQTTH